MRRYHALLLFWLLSDLLLFVGMYALAYFLRVGWIFSTDFPFGPYITVACVIAPLWILTLVGTRMFALTRNQKSPKSAAYITYSTIIGVSLFALTYYFSYGLFFSRKLLLYAFVLSTVAVWAWHVIFGLILRKMLQKDPSAFRALIIGVTRESKELILELNQKQNPIKPVVILDGRGVKETDIDGIPVRGKLNKLEDVLREEKITHLIQCADLEQSLNLLSACRTHGIHYMLLPSVLGIVERDERVESLEGHPVIIVSPQEKKWKWFFQ